MTVKARIFISYAMASEVSKKLALRLYQALQESFDPFFDKECIPDGLNDHDVLFHNTEMSDGAVILLSPEVNESNYVPAESMLLMQKNRYGLCHVIPVLVPPARLKNFETERMKPTGITTLQTVIDHPYADREMDETETEAFISSCCARVKSDFGALRLSTQQRGDYEHLAANIGDILKGNQRIKDALDCLGIGTAKFWESYPKYAHLTLAYALLLSDDQHKMAEAVSKLKIKHGFRRKRAEQLWQILRCNWVSQETSRDVFALFKSSQQGQRIVAVPWNNMVRIHSLVQRIAGIYAEDNYQKERIIEISDHAIRNGDEGIERCILDHFQPKNKSFLKRCFSKLFGPRNISSIKNEINWRMNRADKPGRVPYLIILRGTLSGTRDSAALVEYLAQQFGPLALIAVDATSRNGSTASSPLSQHSINQCDDAHTWDDDLSNGLNIPDRICYIHNFKDLSSEE